MNNLQFTIPEILLLIGIAQCLYVIVYLAFRSGKISRGTLPLLYFITMGVAFTGSFLNDTLVELIEINDLLIWALWGLQFPLCVLLIIQVAQIYKVPSWHQYWIFLLQPAAYLLVHNLAQSSSAPHLWYNLAGLIAAALCLASLWFNRNMIETLKLEKNNKDRYWLILALLFTNAAFVAFMLFHLGMDAENGKLSLIKTLFGLALVYLTSTSLFRIYPQAVYISDPQKTASSDGLGIYEQSIAKKIEELIYVQKVYQEPTYSRADLARECEAPEALISKILSVHFNQSFPQLINKNRVEDAKNLLTQTNEPMTVIATESGFNSLASFNRVFKEIAGTSPSEFRAKKDA